MSTALRRTTSSASSTQSSAETARNGGAAVKVVMLVDNACTADRRVIGEAEALAAAGYDVAVICRATPMVPRRTFAHGVQYIRVRGKPPSLQTALRFLRRKLDLAKGKTVGRTEPGLNNGHLSSTASTTAAPPENTPGLFRLLVRSLYWTGEPVDFAAAAYRAACREQPNVVHAHDLTTLPAGLATARRCGASLIYDSHELEAHRNIPYPTVVHWWRMTLERICIARTSAVVTVSKSLADHLNAAYPVAPPAVIENVPRPSDGGEPASDVRATIGLPDESCLAVYVGAIVPNRGIEETIAALAHGPEIHLAVVGPDAHNHIPPLHALAKRIGVEDRLTFIPPVPPASVSRFISTATVSVIPIQNSCLSYKYCFPNKLMESIYAGLPVAVARLDELQRFVENFGCGAIMNETDPADIARTIQKIARDRDAFAPTAATITQIDAQHGWQVQEERLLELYAKLLKPDDT